MTWPPWHTYTDHLQEMLHHMNTDDTFADVTLVCDDGSQIRAHKVVLGASSPILKNMLITDIHIQYKHEGVKYACKQCDKQFTTQSKSVNSY